jgi:DNA-binding IclR family transcriptional regulator
MPTTKDLKFHRTAAAAAGSGLQSIYRSALVLRELAAADRMGLRLTDIARRTGLGPPTVHRILKRLVVEGFVTQRRHSRVYSLGPLVYELGLAAATQYDIRAECQSVMETLAQSTGDTVFLNVRSGNDAVCIERKEGWYPIKTLIHEIGSRRPLGVGAGGLALMFSLSEEEVREVMAANAHKIASYGHLTAEKVYELYRLSRSLGYGLTEELTEAGVSAVAIPVTLDEGRAYAALSIIAITSRMHETRRRELVALLREKAAILEFGPKRASSPGRGSGHPGMGQ